MTFCSYITIRNIENTEHIKGLLSMRQAEVTSTIERVDTQIVSAERSLASLHTPEDGQSSQQDEEDMEDAMRAIAEGVAMLQVSQKIMRPLTASMGAKLRNAQLAP
jgi:hypothetical protein